MRQIDMDTSWMQHSHQYHVDAKQTIQTSAPKEPTLISLCDPHKFISVSQDICSMLGFTPEEMSGRSIKILHGPRTDTTALTAMIKRCTLHHHQPEPPVPLTIYCRDGSSRDVLASCAPSHDEHGVIDGLRVDIAIASDDESIEDASDLDEPANPHAAADSASEIRAQAGSDIVVQDPNDEIECYSFRLSPLRLERGRRRARHNEAVGRDTDAEGRRRHHNAATAAIISASNQPS
jgi:PAS domain S-box-containing protein